MITRILFPHNLAFKPSEDSGLRTTQIGLNQSVNEIYCLPGALNGQHKTLTNKCDVFIRKNKNVLSNIGKTLITKREKPLILHVEDSSEIRFLVSVLLRNEFEVHSSETGEKALEMLKENQYDIILMDLNLGEGLSGIEVTATIRMNDSLRRVPIIAITANNYHEVREDCIDAGMNAFIQKPFDKADLIATIQELTIN